MKKEFAGMEGRAPPLVLQVLTSKDSPREVKSNVFKHEMYFEVQRGIFTICKPRYGLIFLLVDLCALTSIRFIIIDFKSACNRVF